MAVWALPNKTCWCIFIYMYVFIRMYLYLYLYMHTYMYMYMNMYMCMCMCKCICVWIYGVPTESAAAVFTGLSSIITIITINLCCSHAPPLRKSNTCTCPWAVITGSRVYFCLQPQRHEGAMHNSTPGLPVPTTEKRDLGWNKPNIKTDIKQCV